MTRKYCNHTAILILFVVGCGACPSLNASEPETSAEPYRVWFESESESDCECADPQFAIESDFEPDFVFVQDQESGGDSSDQPAIAAPPIRSRSQAVATRRRRSTYRLPSMFGDYFGSGLFSASTMGQPIPIPQSIREGIGGVDLFVTNSNGGVGADPNPAVVIQIFDGSPTGPRIASSIGPGVTQGSNVVYPISEPTIAEVSPPPTNGHGTLVYAGGTATGQINNGDNWGLDFSHTFTPDPIGVVVPSGGVAVRRLKISENNSPLPRDRFIANYNFFNDVIGGIGDVNRYTFGFEQTLFNESSSIQFLLPFASTLAADQVAGGTIAKNTEFGDVSLVFKTMLVERYEYVLAAGVGLTLPTGSDARVFNTTGDEIIHIDHASIHVSPYLALLRAYDSGWYWQTFLQMDIDTNGNEVQADLMATNLQYAGVLQEQNLLFADLGIGYQFNELVDGGSPAIAATGELHYATTLQDSDVVQTGGLDIRNPTNRFDVLNLTLGLNVQTHQGISIRPAMVIPLRSGDDEHFDYEAMVQMNYWR